MTDPQGLSAENRALAERTNPALLKRLGAYGYVSVDPRALNCLLDAARTEGPRPAARRLDPCGTNVEPFDLKSAKPAVLKVEEWRSDIASAPQDGTPIRVQTYEVLRWLAYKPDGARQMKRTGRWQKHDGFGWTNCPDPHGKWQPADTRGSPTDSQTSDGAG